MPRPTSVSLLVAAVASLACAGGAAPERLKPESALVRDCFQWPEEPWSPKHKSGPVSLRLDAGDAAVDFTLKDVGGRSHQLSDLLRTKPVLLVQGSYTCPRFQENEAGLNASASSYDDAVHTVFVYNIEAHPKDEPNPYSGRPKPQPFSDRGQPRTDEQRLRHAKDVELRDPILVLVDDLEEGANPIWCTYGSCASCAWLIRQDGGIEAAHLWYDPPSMQGSIDALLRSTGAAR